MWLSLFPVSVFQFRFLILFPGSSVVCVFLWWFCFRFQAFSFFETWEFFALLCDSRETLFFLLVKKPRECFFLPSCLSLACYGTISKDIYTTSRCVSDWMIRKISANVLLEIWLWFTSRWELTAVMTEAWDHNKGDDDNSRHSRDDASEEDKIRESSFIISWSCSSLFLWHTEWMSTLLFVLETEYLISISYFVVDASSSSSGVSSSLFSLRLLRQLFSCCLASLRSKWFLLRRHTHLCPTPVSSQEWKSSHFLGTNFCCCLADVEMRERNLPSLKCHLVKRLLHFPAFSACPSFLTIITKERRIHKKKGNKRSQREWEVREQLISNKRRRVSAVFVSLLWIQIDHRSAKIDTHEKSGEEIDLICLLDSFFGFKQREEMSEIRNVLVTKLQSIWVILHHTCTVVITCRQ